MKFLDKKSFATLLVTILIVTLTASSVSACNVAIATGKATKDGSVILAKNSNRPNEECQWMVSYPGGDHNSGETVKCTWLEIQQTTYT